MSKDSWTFRDYNIPPDAGLIRGIVERDRIAARIFITGEVHENYIGEAARRRMFHMNDAFYEDGTGLDPLFLVTKEDTIRMTRYDPEFVWRCIHPDILIDLVNDESNRLGIEMDPYLMDHFDYYESAIAALEEKKGGFVLPMVKQVHDIDYLYNAFYLSALLFFKKPGHMGIPVASQFANPINTEQLKRMEYRELDPEDQKKAGDLIMKYKDVKLLTNPELFFITSLYEKAVRRKTFCNNMK